MGESPSAPGSIPGMECLRSITPLAHRDLPSTAFALCSVQNRIRGVDATFAPLCGQSRSSTAIERPKQFGRRGFDSHRARQFRRAVEFGLSVKSERTSGFKSLPSRQMAGFPTRLLSVVLVVRQHFQRAVDCGFSWTRQWRFKSAPRSTPRWCNASTPGKSMVAFLSAALDGRMPSL